MAGFFSKIFGKGRDALPPEPVAQVGTGERVYAIGDIHGRIDLLVGLLDKIGDDIAKHHDNRVTRFVFLGDYVDRGDHSCEVIEALMQVEQELGAGAVFLRGNHEAALMRFIDDQVSNSEWLSFGGTQTLGSYRIAPPVGEVSTTELLRIRAELREAMGVQCDFLARTRMMYQSGDVVFAHAGIDPALPLDAQEERALLWGDPDLRRSTGVEGLRIVHGHFDSREAVVRPERICVDTGAYYSGQLTAVRLDTETTLISIDVFDL